LRVVASLKRAAMPEVSITEAKRDFFKIIRRVLQGEDFVITRYGKPVAKLVPLVVAAKETDSSK
jgi:prevent-host-death family protein